MWKLFRVLWKLFRVPKINSHILSKLIRVYCANYFACTVKINLRVLWKLICHLCACQLYSIWLLVHTYTHILAYIRICAQHVADVSQMCVGVRGYPYKTYNMYIWTHVRLSTGGCERMWHSIVFFSSALTKPMFPVPISWIPWWDFLWYHVGISQINFDSTRAN